MGSYEMETVGPADDRKTLFSLSFSSAVFPFVNFCELSVAWPRVISAVRCSLFCIMRRCIQFLALSHAIHCNPVTKY